MNIISIKKYFCNVIKLYEKNILRKLSYFKLLAKTLKRILLFILYNDNRTIAAIYLVKLSEY